MREVLKKNYQNKICLMINFIYPQTNNRNFLYYII